MSDFFDQWDRWLERVQDGDVPETADQPERDEPEVAAGAPPDRHTEPAR